MAPSTSDSGTTGEKYPVSFKTVWGPSFWIWNFPFTLLYNVTSNIALSKAYVLAQIIKQINIKFISTAAHCMFHMILKSFSLFSVCQKDTKWRHTDYSEITSEHQLHTWEKIYIALQWSGRTEQLHQQLNRDIVKTILKLHVINLWKWVELNFYLQ